MDTVLAEHLQRLIGVAGLQYLPGFAPQHTFDGIGDAAFIIDQQQSALHEVLKNSTSFTPRLSLLEFSVITKREVAVREKQASASADVARYCGVNFRTVIRWIDR